MPILNWQLFDRLRAYFKRSNIYRQDNLYQDQSNIDRVVSNGNFIEFSRQAGLLEQTNLQINRLERYKDYDMMDEVGEITLALDLYADESSLIDPERKHSMIVRTKNEHIKQVSEDFLYNTLMIDRDIRPLIRYLCKYGCAPFEIVPTQNRDGIASLRFINVYNFTRVQTKFGDLVGFYYQDPNTLTPIFLHPWQVVHMRLTSFDSSFFPYGRSILDGVRKDFKRLRLMEDAALIYRITRAPEKRVFSIPIGNIPANEIYAYITNIARQFKKHKFVDPGTGQINERYSPLIQEDDYFLPKRADGSGPTIDTLPGAQNLDEIEDILYFKKKMISGMKIPFSRVGIGQQTDTDGKSLSSVSPEFAKAIQWIQREAVYGIKKVLIVHLAMQGYSIEDIKSVDLAMTAASAIDELYRIETWNTRADVIGTLHETGMFTDDWILRSFTNLTDDEIDEMARKLEKKAAEGGGEEEELGGEGGGDLLGLGEALDPQEKRLIQEYVKYAKRIVERDPLPRRGEDVLNMPVEYYVNQKELDALPQPDGKLLVENSIPKETIDEVKAQYEMLLSVDAGIDIEPNKNLLTESVPIEESDIPGKDS
jgi:hypothetical protein